MGLSMDVTDTCLRGVFQAGISRVMVRVRCRCDVGYESLKLESLAYRW